MEKFDIPLAGHSVAVLVNGEISAETLKSYAKTFTDNKLNYAFVGQTLKIYLTMVWYYRNFICRNSTLFDSVIVLSDGSELLLAAEEFAEMTYNHKKPLL